MNEYCRWFNLLCPLAPSVWTRSPWPWPSLWVSCRYDIRIYPSFLHLHGKTFDYKIPYTTVLRLFLLPHKDQRQMFFVVR